MEGIIEKGWQRDLRSKFLDGLLPAVVLYLLIMLIVLSLNLIQRRFEGPGLFMYMLGLMAVAMFSLQRGLVSRYAETTRAWYGIAGGMLAWAVAQIGSLTNGSSMADMNAILLLIMLSLTIALLWRQHLPVGAHFFAAVFLGNWAGHIFLTFFQHVSNWSPAIQVLYRILGISMALGAVGVMGWIFLFSERRIYRMWASLLAVFLFAGAIFVLNGRLF